MKNYIFVTYQLFFGSFGYKRAIENENKNYD